MLRFRWIRKIRLRIPGGPKIEYSTAILAHLAGKWGPILGSTLEKPKENQCFQLQPLKMLRKIKVLRLWEPLGDPKGVLAGPGTPRDPPNNLFGPNRVAIWSFLAFPAPSCTELRRGSRQGGPTPSISTFFFTFFGMIFGKMPIFGKKTLESCLVTADFRPAGRGPGAPRGPVGPHGAPWGPWGPRGYMANSRSTTSGGDML